MYDCVFEPSNCNGSIQCSRFLLHQLVVLQVCLDSDRANWVLSSDKITAFMCAEFQTEWLSDRACKFPQVSLLALPPSLPYVMGWHCCCLATTATWTGASILLWWSLLLACTAAARTVHPGAHQSFCSKYTCAELSSRFSNTNRNVLPRYNLPCSIGWAGIYLTSECVH